MCLFIIVFFCVAFVNATGNESLNVTTVAPNEPGIQLLVNETQVNITHPAQNKTFVNESFASKNSTFPSVTPSAGYTNNSSFVIQTTSASSQSNNSLIKKTTVESPLAIKLKNKLAERKAQKIVDDAKIVEQERKLSKRFLIQDDSIDATSDIHGFSANNETTSLVSSPTQGRLKQTAQASVRKTEANVLPQGGFIQHSPDGRTRVFSPEGKQLFYAVDNRTEKVQTPSGNIVPATFLIAVPSESSLNIVGDHTYVTYQGEIILSVIQDNKTGSWQEYNAPATKGTSWVEYASTRRLSATPIGEFNADWIIPHSPQLNDNLDQNGNPTTPPHGSEMNSKVNILFNGIQPTNGSLIIQPVTAFNYRINCQETIGTIKFHDECTWNNVWTGSVYYSTWIQGQPEFYHTYPPVNFVEGNEARGWILWDPALSQYMVYIINMDTGSYNGLYTGTVQSPNPFQDAVVTYEAYPQQNDQYPTWNIRNDEKLSDITFHNMYGTDINGNAISLNWYNETFTSHPLLSGLNVDLSQAPSTVKLETNHVTTPTPTPVVNFTATPIFGTAPLAIQFLDTSTNTPTGWSWTFGDGDTTNATVQHPLHTYLFHGEYTVSLTASNSMGNDTVTRVWLIRVTESNADKLGSFRDGDVKLDYNGNSMWDESIDKHFTWTGAGYSAVVGDWNGDGKTEFGSFRDGDVKLDYNGNGIWDEGIDKHFAWTAAGYSAVVGDWNGDGKTDFGTFHDGDVWLDYNGNFAWDAGIDKHFAWTGAGYSAVVGDWNGDGKTNFGAFRDGNVWLDYNGNFAWDAGIDKNFAWTGAGYSAIAGDWNGDGKTNFGAFRDGNVWLDYNDNFAWDAGIDKNFAWTGAGYSAIAGDWNGDGKTNFGAFRDGDTWLDYNGNFAWDAGIDKHFIWGGTGYTPIVGKWS